MAITSSTASAAPGNTVSAAQQQVDDSTALSGQTAGNLLDSTPFSLAMASLRFLLPAADPARQNLEFMQKLAQSTGSADDDPDSDDDDEGDE